MRAERIDHTKALFRGFPGEDPQREQAELPLVGPGLVEHLEAKFPREPPFVAQTQDHAVAIVAAQSWQAGVRSVIDYLKSLVPTEEGRIS